MSNENFCPDDYWKRDELSRKSLTDFLRFSQARFNLNRCLFLQEALFILLRLNYILKKLERYCTLNV